MAQLTDIRDRVYRLLSDLDGTQFDVDLIDDGIVAAHDAILPWVFKRSNATLEGDGETVLFELPTDYYRMVAVYDADQGINIPQNILSAYQSPGQNIETNQDWIEYPEGYISFANAPEEDVILYYGAKWTYPTADTDVLEVPDWLLQAVVLYAASYSLMEKASNSSNIRQWNIQQDSGTPVMNPMKDMSSYLLERFTLYMKMIPARERGARNG